MYHHSIFTTLPTKIQVFSLDAALLGGSFLSIKEPTAISYPHGTIAITTCHQKKLNGCPVTQLVSGGSLSTDSLTLEAISLASTHGLRV